MKLNGGCLGVIAFISYWILFAFILPFPKYVAIEDRIVAGILLIVIIGVLAMVYILGQAIFEDSK